MHNLVKENTPRNFWRCQPDFPDEVWENAISGAIPELGLSHLVDDIKTTLNLTLGEGRFGPNHWHLNWIKRFYYLLKPYLPRAAIDVIKNFNSHLIENRIPLNWLVEERYVQFQWEILRKLLRTTHHSNLKFRRFWPDGYRYALVLTHDIETSEGQKFALNVADLEESLGFRSSFNFVPERYKIDPNLLKELRDRGFEIGIHGLKHDGKLFRSHDTFRKRVRRINHYLKEFDAVGFRSPLTHRNPYWMQELDIEYDLSFFDTDPYEPIPGGCMSIWPFFIGKFVELPYTLLQDCTLGLVLGKSTPQLWIDKVKFLKQYFGMALLNSHPDYLLQPKIWNLYADFLNTMKNMGDFWHVLPREVARWWQKRKDQQAVSHQEMGTITLQKKQIIIK